MPWKIGRLLCWAILAGTAPFILGADSSGDESLRTFGAPSGPLGNVFEVAFSPDGRTVLSASANGIHLWDVATGAEIRNIMVQGGASVAFSPDRKTAVSAGNGDTLKLWDLATGNEIRTFERGSAPQTKGLKVHALAFSPDGSTVLSGSSESWDCFPECAPPNETLELWDVETGKILRTFVGELGRVDELAFAPDGRSALSAEYWGASVKLWDVATGKEIRTFETSYSEPRCCPNRVNSVAFSPDGRSALSGLDGGTVELWDLTTGKDIRTFLGQSEPVLSVAFSPDGRTALSGSRDHTLTLWDVASGQLRCVLSGRPNGAVGKRGSHAEALEREPKQLTVAG
jgi:WD40 repeat protein